MKALAAALTLLSLLLLAAHGLRWGNWGLCALWLSLTLLPLLRQAWVRLALQGALLLGAWQWLQASMMLVQMRMATGAPWHRLGAIMAGVLLVTLAAAVLLQHSQVRTFFHKRQETAWPQALAFLLTFVLLYVAQIKAPLPLLLSERLLPQLPGVGLYQIFLHALYAALLAGPLMQPARHRRLRPIIWGVFSFVFFSQLALGLAGLPELLMTGKLHLPVPAMIVGGPLYRGHGFFMPILFASTVVLVGSAWCSHLCYIGAWDDGCSRLKGKAPQPSLRAPWRGRLGTLLLTVAAALGLRWSGISWQPAIILASAFGAGGVVVMLSLSRARSRMVHCTAWCPLGLVSVLLARLTPWRVRMAADCTRCGKCSRVCRYGALRPEDIEAGRPNLSCTLCGDCMSACKHGQLHYSLAGLKPQFSRAAFIVLVCSLHSGFLAVARI